MRFLNWLLGIDSLMKTLRAAPYRGQPVMWTKRGLVVKVRRRL